MDKDFKNLIKKLPLNLQVFIDNNYSKNITEIRIRCGFDIKVCIDGKFVIIPNTKISNDEIEMLFFSLCENTLFAYEKQIEKGFITLPGGYRVGIGGNFYSDDEGEHLLNVNSLNIRIVKDVEYTIPSEILNFKKGILVVGKPHSGKTTFLKSICSHLYESNIAVCDERRELYTPKLNCDFISGIEKSKSIERRVRTLNPDIVICDEIGNLKESREILDSMHTGVKFICSVHNDCFETLKYKPGINLLLESKVFDKMVLLSNIENNFFVKEIQDV